MIWPPPLRLYSHVAVNYWRGKKALWTVDCWYPDTGGKHKATEASSGLQRCSIVSGINPACGSTSKMCESHRFVSLGCGFVPSGSTDFSGTDGGQRWTLKDHCYGLDYFTAVLSSNKLPLNTLRKLSSQKNLSMYLAIQLHATLK